jgi:hypothetical protein
MFLDPVARLVGDQRRIAQRQRDRRRRNLQRVGDRRKLDLLRQQPLPGGSAWTVQAFERNSL